MSGAWSVRTRTLDDGSVQIWYVAGLRAFWTVNDLELASLAFLERSSQRPGWRSKDEASLPPSRSMHPTLGVLTTCPALNAHVRPPC